MDQFEYKVVPAPTKGRKARGLRRPEEKFAHSIEEIMNEMAGDGWEYQRSETLPHEERTGLTGTSTTFRSLLVFRRPKDALQTPEDFEKDLSAIVPQAPMPQIEDQRPETIAEPEVAASEVKTDRSSEEAEAEEDGDLFSPEKFRAQKPNPNALPAALRQRATRKRSKKGPSKKGLAAE